MNKGLTGLERHERESDFHFGWTIPLNLQAFILLVGNLLSLCDNRFTKAFHYKSSATPWTTVNKHFGNYVNVKKYNWYTANSKCTLNLYVCKWSQCHKQKLENLNLCIDNVENEHWVMKLNILTWYVWYVSKYLHVWQHYNIMVTIHPLSPKHVLFWTWKKNVTCWDF